MRIYYRPSRKGSRVYVQPPGKAAKECGQIITDETGKHFVTYRNTSLPSFKKKLLHELKRQGTKFIKVHHRDGINIIDLKEETE